MADTTTVLAMPFPEGSDANDVPADIQALAERIDEVPGIESLTSAEIAALAAGEKPAGRVVYNSTTSKLQVSNGTSFADVDAAALASAALKLPLAGGTMSGNIAMGGSKVTGLAEADTNGDAVRYEQLAAVGTWQSYTPTLGQGGAVAWDAGASRARYVQVGKMVVVYCSLKVTGSGVAGQPITVSLPAAAVAIGAGVGSFYNFDPGVAHRSGAAYLNATTYADLYRSGDTDRFGIAGPTLGATDVIGMSIVYEAA